MKSISYQMDELEVLPYLCNSGKDKVTQHAIYYGIVDLQAGSDETCEQTQQNRTRTCVRERQNHPTAQQAR
jgi:hypothetical protein